MAVGMVTARAVENERRRNFSSGRAVSITFLFPPCSAHGLKTGEVPGSHRAIKLSHVIVNALSLTAVLFAFDAPAVSHTDLTRTFTTSSKALYPQSHNFV